MTTYRIDRRFVLRSLGVTLVLVGVLVAAGIAASGNAGVALACLVPAGLLLANATYLFVRPPLVVIATDEDLRLGGRLTVRPIWVPWQDVVGVRHDGERLLLDRGEEHMVVFPLAYVGARRDALVRDLYDRLNTANGYRRFDPS